MSKISQLLREYSQVHISYAVVGKDPAVESKRILNQLVEELSQNEWKCPPSEVPTDAIAMSAFFEMFAHKIGGDVPIMLCYYYSSRVANDKSFPANVQTLGNMFRAFIVFKAMDKLNTVFNLACNAPFAGYRGKLKNQQFFDFALISDVYKAWDRDNNDALLNNLKKQVPIVASNYPMFNKQQIIAEGELAHEAILNVVRTFIKL
ncbi:MAG: hypothetical protein IKW46_01420 [Bacteroidaceae bacterium]|nr:hypothetical protein [Bacteroidaceae bacterium]